jgi:hypothetical protein
MCNSSSPLPHNSTMAFDFTDFYILYEGYPKYNSSSLIEDDLIRVIVQKYQMILMTNKGEVMGDPDFGANLEEILNETNVSQYYVKEIIDNQISTYIPEILGTSYDLNVYFAQDPENYRDIMFVNLKISEYNIVTQI